MPNYGTVSFWDTNTTWMAEAATQLDYFVTVPPAGCPPSKAGPAIMRAYVDAVGHSPAMPQWATGYWHSRNRYSSQGMLLDAAKGFHERGINVSVIVIDYMHWVHSEYTTHSLIESTRL
jgi:alpha-D-xyloside xylohydrolase